MEPFANVAVARSFGTFEKVRQGFWIVLLLLFIFGCGYAGYELVETIGLLSGGAVILLVVLAFFVGMVVASRFAHINHCYKLTPKL